MGKMKNSSLLLFSAVAFAFFAAGGSPCFAQIDINIHTATTKMDSHVYGFTGHAFDDGQGRPDAGAQLYRRYCIGCHGAEGDGTGENAMWFDPTMGYEKPRDFTEAVFKCRSTPTGTLPTDEDLFDSVTRGFVTTNMPSWKPLTEQERANLVAMVKSFSLRWSKEKPGTPITIPTETPATIESILHGRELFQNIQCWKCHGSAGKGDGPSASTLTDTKGEPIRPFDFAESDRFKCGVTNRDMYRDFMTGLDGTPMPSFSDNIKPEEGWDLVHFLRTLMTSIKTPERATFDSWVKSHPGQLKPIGEQAPPGTAD
jgi:mono/diheme cytochrome c family protein